MLGLGLSLLTGGSLRPYYAVVAAAFKDRVEADGGTVESMSCLKADLKVLNPIKPPAYTGLLNDYSGAAAAYSLRLLDNTYSGSAVRVRRASDNAEQDIAFSNNELDTATLESFASGTDAFVTTWYDQSGNANNATQTTASSQPKIVSSGSTILENGKPAVQNDGSNDYLVNTGGLTTSDNHMILSVHSNITSGFVFSLGYNDLNSILLWVNTSNGSRYWLNGSGNQLNSNEFTTNQRLTIGQQSSGTQSLYIDSSLNSSKSTTYVGDLVPDITIGYALRRNQGSNYYNGYIQECIYFNVDQATNRTGIETNINDYYSIYP